MRLELLRIKSSENSTIGVLWEVLEGQALEPITRTQLCYTLENPKQKIKVPGNTRIWAGDYDIKLRTSGGKHDHYLGKFPDIHKGMLEIIGVRDFKYVLIHIGNFPTDTDGCILVGDGIGSDSIGNSRVTYKWLYSKILKAILSDEGVKLSVKDYG